MKQLAASCLAARWLVLGSFTVFGLTLQAQTLPQPSAATIASPATGNQTAVGAQAMPSTLEFPHGTWLISEENDWFFGTDRDLTDALRLSYSTPEAIEWSDVPGVPEFAGNAFDSITFLNDANVRKTAAFYAQQNMYTPANVGIVPPNPNDRPYAGWLGVGYDLARQTAQRRELVEVNVGLVGPESGAEELQKSWHSIIGSDNPRGWNYQLKNEPVMQLTYRQDYRLLSSPGKSEFNPPGYDVIAHGLITAGNGWDYVATGIMGRIGQNLPLDFGPARQRLGEVETAPYELDPSGKVPDWTGKTSVAYFCFGAEGRAVARDITLDGNTLANSASVSKEPLVAEFYGGLQVEYGDIHAAFLGVLETKTFRAQSQADQWRGVITFGWSF